ncbi:Arc family DNA-binding protein [Pseudomonas sp. PGPPP2]|jgi:hypothetical protein|nr:MAG: transcriptional regulator [Pseudomonas sp. PGPPP2]
MAAVARTQVRIPVDLMDWLKQRAREENRSMNAQLIELLKQARKQSE